MSDAADDRFASPKETAIGADRWIGPLPSWVTQPVRHSDFVATAQAIAEQIEDGLPSDEEIANAYALIAALGAETRLIAFFTTGVTSLASQSVAQFAGWNIPGVGEGDQRFRPRTRLYDTLDPDTVSQVRETLDYARTALLFIMDAPSAPLRHWADALLPAAAAAWPAEASTRDLLACVHAGDETPGDDDATSVVRAIAAAGGRLLRLRTVHALSAAPLLVAAARGLDLAEIRLGAMAELARLREALASGHAESILRWPAMIAATTDTAGRSAAVRTRLELLPLSDRLARSAAWAAGTWSLDRPESLDVSVASQSVTGLLPGQIGLDERCHGRVAPRFVDFLLAGAPVADTDVARAFAAHRRASVEAVLGAGAAVRVVALPSYAPAAYGAFAAQTLWESQLARRLADVRAS